MFPAIQSTARPSGVASPYWITTSKLVRAEGDTQTDRLKTGPVFQLNTELKRGRRLMFYKDNFNMLLTLESTYSAYWVMAWLMLLSLQTANLQRADKKKTILINNDLFRILKPFGICCWMTHNAAVSVNSTAQTNIQHQISCPRNSRLSWRQSAYQNVWSLAEDAKTSYSWSP